MRNSIIAALFILGIAPAARAEMVWNAGAGIRNLAQIHNDGLETKNNTFENKDTSRSVQKTWQFKGNLGVLSKWENIEAGFDVRTYSNPRSEWLNVNNAADLSLNLSQAFVRYKAKPFESDLVATAGRARTVLLYDNMAQMLFDNDTRWDGFGWQWKMGMFGFNAAQYLLGATDRGTAANPSTYTYNEATEDTGDTKSHFGVLYSFQPFVAFQISEDITTTFAVAHHLWSGTGGTATTGWYTNALHGGTVGTVGNLNPVVMDNARQWHFLSDTALPFKLRFVAEYIKNKKSFYGLRNQAATGVTNGPKEADSDALALSIGWGKPKKAGEFGLAYSFSNKGIASVITTFSNGDIAADNRSHMFEGRYMVADNMSLAAKVQFHKEKAHLGGDGQALTSPNDKREQSQQRYEVVGAVSL